MKAVIIRGMCLALFITIFKPYINAQQTSGNAQVVFQQSNNSAGHTVSDRTDLLPKGMSIAAIPGKVIKTFNGTFPGKNEVKWSREANLYMAIFKQDKTFDHVIFNKNGKILRRITYGAIDQLPPELHELLEETYPGFDVTSAVKVLRHNDIIWIVNLSGNCQPEIVVTRVENGEIDELQRFKKSR
jgi:hypothetical protein